MAAKRTITICPECSACPEIKVYDDQVTIGKDDNIVSLKIDEWNNMVDKIKNDEIGKV